MFTSCNHQADTTVKDSSQEASKENDAKFDNKKLEKDAQFLVDAATFSLEEIKLGELAETKGSTAVITGTAKKIVQDHDQSLKHIRELAKSKQISLPDSATKATADAYDMLDSKNGADFNKAYCDRTVEEHKKIIATFEKEAADSRDQDLKEFAETTLPKLRKQLDEVFDCQKKLAIQ